MRTGTNDSGDAPAVARQDRLTGLPGEFQRVWAAFTMNQFGSALGAGALPLAAILLLESSDLQVTLLSAVSGVAAAALALPLGSFIERRRKRGVMVCADLAACTALAGIPVAAALGVLTYVQLCVAATVQTVCAIVFHAANDAYLKALVPEAQRIRANGRMETSLWTGITIGTPVGGALVSAFGLTVTLAADAASHLLSALTIRGTGVPEPPPARRPRTGRVLSEVHTGWVHIFRDPVLHRLFWNGMVFGGCVTLVSPLLALLMLRELGFAPWQYGLALGVAGAGGLLGALCAPKLAGLFGARTILLGFGTLRTCWLGTLYLASPGTFGLALIIVGETLLLFCAGVFNPIFATYRMNRTADGYLARVRTTWSVSAKCFQPAFIALGGVLAAAVGVRAAIGAAAVVLLASSVLLPWRAGDTGSGFDETRADRVAGEGEPVT
ncbi:MFS transporter [Nocardia sp. NPDC024068]|uniref:MFS transporter n=1 Tax=Nocardia sp. NPDC024068 TaxID=3157197 RepID=UPI0033E2CF52